MVATAVQQTSAGSVSASANGVLVLLRLSAPQKASSLTTLFLATTLAASVTGLLHLFAFSRFGVGHSIDIAPLIANATRQKLHL